MPGELQMVLEAKGEFIFVLAVPVPTPLRGTYNVVQYFLLTVENNAQVTIRLLKTDVQPDILF